MEAARKNRVKQFVIDGEAVVLGVDGFTSIGGSAEMQCYSMGTCGLGTTAFLIRNNRTRPQLKRMVRYFFDFRSHGAFSRDDEGSELSDTDAAHEEALNALSDALPEIVIQGATDQNFVIEVRDDLGPVLEVAAVMRSIIFRKQ